MNETLPETQARLTGRLWLVCEPELRDQLERLAAQSDRSVSAEVRRALRLYLAAQQGQPNPFFEVTT